MSLPNSPIVPWRLASSSLRAAGLALAALALGCSETESETTPSSDGPRLSDQLVADLRSIVEATHAESGVPGMALGVWVEGVGELTHSVGVSELGGSQPISFDDHLRIGSITKTFTGTLILQLAHEQALSLDDAVNDYFDGMVPGGDDIKIRHLLSMQSGLESYTFDPAFTAELFADPMRPWEPEELLQIAWDNTAAGCPNRADMCFPAGTAMAYSNTNTVMLGRIAEKVTDRSYAQLVQERIAAPLGLVRTFQGGSDLPGPLARGYTLQGTPDGTTEPVEATTWLPTWAFAVGDMVSTLNELHVYGVALGEGTLVSPEMQAERIALQTVPPNTPDRAYLLGIGIENGWLGHTGELPGYNSAVHYRSDIKALVVTASNRDEFELDGKPAGPASTLARRIEARINEEVPLGTAWPGSEGAE